MSYEVHIISVGYSKPAGEGSFANCTCTVVKGKYNVIVDTMIPWDKEKIIAGLNELGLTCDDIDYVVCTHGHSDHVGNNNLFLKAKHIVGFCISHGDHYYTEPFTKAQDYHIDGEELKVTPTPGHTLSDVSVIVRTQLGTVAITGDLFERRDDVKDKTIWMAAGSENPVLQERNRSRILSIADFIIPGHGDIFSVFDDMRVKPS